MVCKTGRYPYPTCFEKQALAGSWRGGLQRESWRWLAMVMSQTWVKNRKWVIIFPLIRVSGINLWVDALQFGIWTENHHSHQIGDVQQQYVQSAVECPILGELTNGSNGWVGDAPMYFLIGQSTVESNFVAAIDSLPKQMLAGWWFGTFLIFHFIYGMSSFPLTHIFQRGRLKPPTGWFIRGHVPCKCLAGSVRVVDMVCGWGHKLHVSIGSVALKQVEINLQQQTVKGQWIHQNILTLWLCQNSYWTWPLK